MKLTKINLEATRKRRLEGHIIRKGVLVSVSVIILVTSVLLYIVFFVSPDIFWAIPTFFILMFVDFFYIFSILFVKRGRGLIAATTLTFVIILKYIDVTTYLFYLVPLSLGIAVELFLNFKRR